MIWELLIRDIAGLAPDTSLKGSFAIIREIMSPEGLTRLKTYLSQHPPKSDVHMRRIIAAFLDKYAMEDEIEEEISVPGLSERDLVAMTETYETDLAVIEKMKGVRVLTP